MHSFSGNILALDTSSTYGSIAIYSSGKIKFSTYLDIKITHSERVMPQIDLGLNHSGLSLSDIDVICVSNGPGSFTGIRIGLATAKGLSMGHEIPLIPYNSLKVLANNLYMHSHPILCMIDAKMQEIYGALFEPNLEEILKPMNIKPADFLSQIDREVIIIGDGSTVYKDIIEKSGINFSLASLHLNAIQASSMISLFLREDIIPTYDFELISDLEPYYLRKSQAEILKEKK